MPGSFTSSLALSLLFKQVHARGQEKSRGKTTSACTWWKTPQKIRGSQRDSFHPPIDVHRNTTPAANLLAIVDEAEARDGEGNDGRSLVEPAVLPSVGGTLLVVVLKKPAKISPKCASQPSTATTSPTQILTQIQSRAVFVPTVVDNRDKQEPSHVAWQCPTVS